MDLATLEADFAALVFPAFTEETALHLGLTLVEMARVQALPIVINIRSPDRTLFHAALPGSAAINDNWARRKSNTALVFQAPSLLVQKRLEAKGEDLSRHGLSPADYASNGGAVTIRTASAGVVACVTVSGLPQVEDHKLAVAAIRAVLAKG
jgi:uncharacterized protein (UPF0303 family)